MWGVDEEATPSQSGQETDDIYFIVEGGELKKRAVAACHSLGIERGFHIGEGDPSSAAGSPHYLNRYFNFLLQTI